MPALRRESTGATATSDRVRKDIFVYPVVDCGGMASTQDGCQAAGSMY